MKYYLHLQVRDYECDSQGIVNNAVYFNYFEHARNQIFWEKELSLKDLHIQGEQPVVARAEIQYKNPLYARNTICIITNVKTKGTYKLLFEQKIIHVTSQKKEVFSNINTPYQKEMQDNSSKENIFAEATFTVAVIKDGKLTSIKNSIIGELLLI